MSRTFDALREWLQLRARIGEERRFHIEQAAAEFRRHGMSSRAASRKAGVRFGDSKGALRELGGDVRGLANLARAYRVFASPWLQPAVLAAAIALILLLIPARRALIESLIGTPLAEQDREQVIVASGGRNSSITAREFEILRSLASLSEVDRYRTIYVRARARPGIELGAIQSEARARTGNRRLWVGSLFAQSRLLTGPAEVVWVLILIYMMFLLVQAPARGVGRWHLYGLMVALLHALASLTLWTIAVRHWTGSLKLGLIFVGFLLLAAMQCGYWWSDLSQRCPICLDRLILPLTEGTPDRILLNPAITESVCAHGHGVLVESRWTRRFRPEESPLAGLVRA